MMGYSNQQLKRVDEVAERFRVMEERGDKIDRIVVERKEISEEEKRAREVERSKETLLKDDGEDRWEGHEGQERDKKECRNDKEKILIPIVQMLASRKPKPLPVYTVPDQAKVQSLLRKSTFPETPKSNLPSLLSQAEQLYAIHQPHSDIHLILMILHYHSGNYLKVRRHFQEIVTFRMVDPLAYWVAAEAEFSREEAESCLKLTEECMNRLEDRCLPRVLYMKARCYEWMHNYVNSIVCYNQLIKIRPRIA